MERMRRRQDPAKQKMLGDGPNAFAQSDRRKDLGVATEYERTLAIVEAAERATLPARVKCHRCGWVNAISADAQLQ